MFTVNDLILASKHFNTNIMIVTANDVRINHVVESDIFPIIVHAEYYGEQSLHYYSASGRLKGLLNTYHTNTYNVSRIEIDCLL